MSGDTRDARRIAYALVRALQAARSRPPDETLCEARRRELARALEDAARREEPVEIDVRGLSLRVGRGERASLAEEPLRLLAESAADAGLRRVVLPVHESLQRAEDLVALLVDGRSRRSAQSTSPVTAPTLAGGRDPLDDLLGDAPPPPEGAPVRAPADPVCRDATSLTGRLEAIWRGIALERRLDPSELHALGDELAGMPGDAHLEPVRLVPGSDPRESTIAQAINASRLFWLCLRAQGLEEDESVRLLEASLLTDVGMVGVPADVIAHEGRLEQGDFEKISRHPVEGARVLMATPGAPLVSGVLAFEHHMRRAGRGYPRAHGWRPSALSSIYQVCDTYAALRSERAYREALDEDEARSLVRRMADVWFDGRWVALLFEGAAPEGARADLELELGNPSVKVAAEDAPEAEEAGLSR